MADETNTQVSAAAPAAEITNPPRRARTAPPTEGVEYRKAPHMFLTGRVEIGEYVFEGDAPTAVAAADVESVEAAKDATGKQLVRKVPASE